MHIMRAPPLTGTRPAASVRLGEIGEDALGVIEVAAGVEDGLDRPPLKAAHGRGDAHAMKIAARIVAIFRSDRSSNEGLLATFSSRKVNGDCGLRTDDWEIFSWLICVLFLVVAPHL